jgi:glycerol-3-phosphate dehydrogenase
VELVPPLRRDGLRAAGLYPDAETNDARLTLANVRGAADAGAVVLNRAELVGLERGFVAQVSVHGEVVDVPARAVVNATGASIDAVRRLEDPATGTSVTLSKGSHLVLDLFVMAALVGDIQPLAIVYHPLVGLSHSSWEGKRWPYELRYCRDDTDWKHRSRGMT